MASERPFNIVLKGDFGDREIKLVENLHLFSNDFVKFLLKIGRDLHAPNLWT
tara:strand:+ start:4553 stop:4708 length:156 start_codon:yes stop_codon:yes gene_type:complete